MAFYDDAKNPQACEQIYDSFRAQGMSKGQAQQLAEKYDACEPPYRTQAPTGGPDTGADPVGYPDDIYGPEGDEPAPDDFSPGQPSVTLPDGQSYDISLAPVFDRDGIISKREALEAIAHFVLKTPKILALIKRLGGLVVRDAPDDATKGQATSRMALKCMLDQLPEAYQEAVCQYAGGMDYPIGLTRTGEEVFLAFKVVDGMNHLNINGEQFKPGCCCG